VLFVHYQIAPSAKNFVADIQTEIPEVESTALLNFSKILVNLCHDEFLRSQGFTTRQFQEDRRRVRKVSPFSYGSNPKGGCYEIQNEKRAKMGDFEEFQFNANFLRKGPTASGAASVHSGDQLREAWQ
jgi:hypothetical protein